MWKTTVCKRCREQISRKYYGGGSQEAITTDGLCSDCRQQIGDEAGNRALDWDNYGS